MTDIKAQAQPVPLASFTDIVVAVVIVVGAVAAAAFGLGKWWGWF